jgi:hypothetical protein
MITALPIPTRRGTGPLPPTPAAGCDCTVCPFWLHNPVAVEPVCSGRSPDCEYCGCTSAADDRVNGCTRCPIRCGSRVNIVDWMADIGGRVGFEDITVTAALPPLPRLVPQLDGVLPDGFDDQLQWPAYAVGLRRVLSPATFKLSPRLRAATAHEALHLRPGQQAVLLGYAEDPLVEAFWTRRHRDGLYTALAEQRWDLVLTPNASMYANQPRSEHLINFRRNLLMAAEAAAAGIPAVPNIYWLRLEDLERYLDWIAGHPAGGPPAIAVNLQTFRTERDWETHALPGLALFAAALPGDLPVIVTGASRAQRIGALATMFGPGLVLITQNPLQYARHGAVMTPNGRVDVHGRAPDLFAANVRYYASLLTEETPQP